MAATKKRAAKKAAPKKASKKRVRKTPKASPAQLKKYKAAKKRLMSKILKGEPVNI